MRRGAGPGRTRDDHLPLAAQLVALLARAREVRELTELLGEAALSQTDRAYLRFADVFHQQFVYQARHESRSLDETMARAWAVTSLIPRRELSMLPVDLLDAHYQPGTGEEPA
jgi:V/A-type H+-transporting ATPase subunit B